MDNLITIKINVSEDGTITIPDGCTFAIVSHKRKGFGHEVKTVVTLNSSENYFISSNEMADGQLTSSRVYLIKTTNKKISISTSSENTYVRELLYAIFIKIPSA